MIKTKKPVEENNDFLLPPDPERVMEGLRDTGYNFNTALADIIDNSIAADATRIDISVDLNPRDEVTVYIADNGTGMDEDGLKNAMRYGSKQREDPSNAETKEQYEDMRIHVSRCLKKLIADLPDPEPEDDEE